MKYYLIDTSAYVFAAENIGKKFNVDFLQEKANDDAFLYLPQFCVTEVLNTFAKCFHKQKKYLPDKYIDIKKHFLDLIHDRKLIYVYDLHRYHNLNADEIIEKEQTIPLRAKHHNLSSLDILIIAMAKELEWIHIRDEIIILTRDRRLEHIAKEVGISAYFLELKQS